jgi:UDP-N-acetyl-D-galactosamine dehydrogenase
MSRNKIVIVTVPTPVDKSNIPDLSSLANASESIGNHLLKNDLIIFESTVYPGATEEFCVPILEKNSNLTHIKDFNVGYSPERINPGDKENKIQDVIKIISADTTNALDEVRLVYEPIIKAGLYFAPSIKVAEAAKVLENTQRDINIALMNEMSLICEKIGINTFDVIDAASTKWNFLKFSPGLVGGHCIGVDPYYLTFKATQAGYHSEVILAGRKINDDMAAEVAKRIVKKLSLNKTKTHEKKVLILGLTFKENVSDIRNSKVIDLINSLLSFGLNIDVFDPYVSNIEINDISYLESPFAKSKYDSVVLAVSHDIFHKFGSEEIIEMLNPDGFVMDIKGIWSKKVRDILGENYCSL